ncbi:MAG: glucokinase [Pseudorhodoplanes sp.]
MAEILVADIGGTNSRVGFASPGGRPEGIVTLSNDEVDGPEGVLARALEGKASPPKLAVLALASPVTGDEIPLTNRDWIVRPRELAKRFGIARVHVLNDFEAIAHALPVLGEADLEPIGPAAAYPQNSKLEGVKLAIGPGTGLGASALVPTANGFHALATEAGHMSFGPAYPDEMMIFHRILEKQTPLSVEHILSGSGLARLHRAMHPDFLALQPDMILRQAHAGDRAARATIAMFVRLFGRFAGDMALALRATGGVYIAGGVAGRLGSLFDASLFRAAFERHPPYEAMLQAIPSALIICPEPGLIGCAAYAQRLLASS